MNKENIFEFMGENIHEKDFYNEAPKIFVENIRKCQATRKLREPEEFDRNDRLYYHPTLVDEKKVYECIMALDYLPYSINRKEFMAGCVKYCALNIRKNRREFKSMPEDNLHANDRDSIYYSIVDYTTILNVMESQIVSKEQEMDLLGY